MLIYYIMFAFKSMTRAFWEEWRLPRACASSRGRLLYLIVNSGGWERLFQSVSCLWRTVPLAHKPLIHIADQVIWSEGWWKRSGKGRR